MTKILFICWGNICRSPMAEFIFNDMARRHALDGALFAASAGVSDEEEGNGVYPPVRRLLSGRGIDCSEKRARRLRQSDYAEYDLLVCMDRPCYERTCAFFGGDSAQKVRNLLDYAGRVGEEIPDPWYTRDFEAAERDIVEGCAALLDSLKGIVTLDLRACRDREDLYAVLRSSMSWEDWYGENLDALWDLLTGSGNSSASYRVLPPESSSPAADYAARMIETFREAGKLKED